jgi:quinoprotein dehydrogenase-associated SoxYZ-like carrier
MVQSDLDCANGLHAGLGGAPSWAAENPWPGLAGDVFKSRPLEDGSALLALDMPARAEDAAIVPIAIRSLLPAADPRRITAFTIVIDQNPAPVAASFALGPGVSSLSTRVRVDSYTNVHAVAELSDGKLHVVETYVKASGGCSAPALKNADAATATLGQMKLRLFAKSAERSAREAQIMVRYRPADGPAHPALHPGLFRSGLAGVARQRSRADHGRRHLDLAGPEHPLQLRAERREDVPRRGDRHRGSRVPG